MYCDFFGLRCRPFEDRADPHAYYPTPEREEAIAAMQYAAHYGRGLALVLGESGTGKTLLARTLLQRLPNTDQVVILTCPGNGAFDLLREACKGFGVTLPTTPTAMRCLARLRRHLERARKANRRSILIVDEAENLCADGLSQLATLCGLQREGSALLRVIVSAQPRLRTLLERPEFVRLRQGLCGEHTIPALTREEAESYLQHRLRVAGAGDAQFFDAEAITILHRVCQGVPRLLNFYADAALLAAYAAGERRVSTALAMEVTSQGTLRQRTISAGELGLISASDVAAGQTPGTPRAPRTPSEPAEIVGQGIQSTSTATDSGAAGGGFESGIGVVGPGSATPWMHAAPIASNTTLVTDHEALLCRLEAAVARAERTAATTEVGTAKYTAVEQHLVALATRADRIAATLAGAIERANDAADRVQRQSAQNSADTEARTKLLESQTARATDAAAVLEQAAANLERNRGQAEYTRARLTAFADQLADRAAEVQERVSTMMGAVETSERTRHRIEERLGGLAQNFECAIEEHQSRLKGLVAQFQAKAQAITDALAEMEAAIRRAGELRQETSIWEGTLGRLSEGRREADAACARIAQAADSARDQVQTLSQIGGQAAEERQRLAAQFQRADELGAELKILVEGAAASKRGIETATTEVDERGATLDARIQKLHEIEAPSRRLLRELEEAGQSAAEIREALQGTSAVAEQKLGQLGSQLAAGAQTARVLGEANIAGRETIELARQAGENVRREVEQCGDRALILEAQVREISASMEQHRCLLAEEAAAAETATQALTAAHSAAEPLATNLAQLLEEGKQLAEAVIQRLSEAGPIADRLGNLTQQLPDAEQFETAVRQAAEHAATTIARLEATIASSSRARNTLSDSVAEGQRILADLSGWRQEWQAHSERLHELLLRTEEAVESRSPLLANLLLRTDELAQRLEVLSPKIEELERNLHEATVAPGAMAEAAQTQAAQLEQVCTAVRKVFGSLSKSGLDAARQTEECRKAGESAAVRLGRLRAETQASKRTLQEWVAEAMRAQARLEKTLQLVPAIQDTHPGSVIRQVSQSLDLPDELPDAGDTEPAWSDEPLAPAEREPVRRVVRRGRAEEIAALIEDARRASEGGE